jgi:hypothetical protein
MVGVKGIIFRRPKGGLNISNFNGLSYRYWNQRERTNGESSRNEDVQLLIKIKNNNYNYKLKT